MAKVTKVGHWVATACMVGGVVAVAGSGGEFAAAKAEANGRPPSSSAHGAGRIDMSEFEHVLSDQQDFAALVVFLAERHGIYLGQLLGVGSASVIFAAEKEVDTDVFEMVTIKIIDHDLVRTYVRAYSRACVVQSSFLGPHRVFFFFFFVCNSRKIMLLLGCVVFQHFFLCVSWLVRATPVCGASLALLSAGGSVRNPAPS